MIAKGMLVAGLLLLLMCRLDILGHALPQWTWTAVAVAVALWLGGAIVMVRRTPLLVIPAAILLYLFPFNFADFEPAGIPNESKLLGYLETNNVVGAAVGIHLHGQTHFAGYGGVEKFGEIPSPRTPYQIASVTKIFTGDVLSEQFDPALVPLATHSSGLPDATAGKSFPLTLLSHPFDFYAGYGADEIERDLTYLNWDSRNQLTPANGRWQYSNLGFCLLGMKLGMANQRFGAIGYERPENVAAGYNAAAVRTKLWTPGVCHGAGGLHASAADLLDYVRLPTSAKVIRFDDGHHRMGLGWMFRDGIWYHGGSTFGNTAFVAHEPRSDTALVVLISGVARDIESFGLDFMRSLILEHTQQSVPADRREDAAPAEPRLSE